MKLIPVWAKIPVAATMLVLLAGCASQSAVAPKVAPRSIGMIGVALAPQIESGKSQSAMVREFQQLIQASGRFQTLSANDVARAVDSVSPGSYRSMMTNYGETGQLQAADAQALSAARLPVRTVLIARLEKNEVRDGTPRRVQLRNNAGQVMTDRERVVLSTIREMRLQASLINLSTGRVTWSKTYRSAPAAESSYIHYSGSSFSGSLAASFANTMSNGLRVPSGPDSPSNHQTLHSLMREVVRNLPSR